MPGEALSADLLDVDRAAGPPVPSEKAVDDCEFNLRSYRWRASSDELRPKNHYVVVPSAVKIADETPPEIEHPRFGFVIAFCRRGCHEGFRHVLLYDGQVVTVHSDVELRKVFKYTAEKLHLDLTPASAVPNDAKLKLLVEALGDNDFTAREEAAATLSKAGAAATKMLEAGSRSDDVERSSRCKSLLKSIKPVTELQRELGVSK